MLQGGNNPFAKEVIALRAGNKTLKWSLNSALLTPAGPVL